MFYFCNLCTKKYLHLKSYIKHMEKIHHMTVKCNQLYKTPNQKPSAKAQQYQAPYPVSVNYPIVTSQQLPTISLQHQQYPVQDHIILNHTNDTGNTNVNVGNTTVNAQLNLPQDFHLSTNHTATISPNCPNSTNKKQLRRFQLPKFTQPLYNTSSYSNQIHESYTFLEEPNLQEFENLNCIRSRLNKFLKEFSVRITLDHMNTISTFRLLLKQNEINDDVALEELDNGYHFEYCMGYFTTTNDANKQCHCTNFFVKKQEILRIMDLYQQG